MVKMQADRIELIAGHSKIIQSSDSINIVVNAISLKGR